MTKLETMLRSKFRGCLLGGLVGDCFGSPFEGDEMTAGSRLVLQRNFDKLDDPTFTGPFKPYTDDTAMTKSIAKTLIEKPAVDYNFMARQFVNEFFKEPSRGYGQSVTKVFEKLYSSKFQNIYKPAQEQFNGTGSFGNGGAMRVAPIALYFHDNQEACLKCAEEATRLTHTNYLGINGALLLSIAIQEALGIPPNQPINPVEFTENLLEKVKTIERCTEDSNQVGPYENKLHSVKHLLGKKNSIDDDEDVIFMLGNGINAIESVPTAIFCFLRALNDIPGVNTDNIFRRTVQYAISLGGDTDTIGNMAGQLAGAYLGEEGISQTILKHCEYNEEMKKLADKLYNAVNKS